MADLNGRGGRKSLEREKGRGARGERGQLLGAGKTPNGPRLLGREKRGRISWGKKKEKEGGKTGGGTGVNGKMFTLYTSA